MWTGESAALAITIASRVRCVACAYLHIYGAVPGALEVKQEKNLKYRIMAVGGEGGGQEYSGCFEDLIIVHPYERLMSTKWTKWRVDNPLAVEACSS